MSGSIHDFIDEALTHAQAVWEAVVPADLSNLHELPSHVAQSLDSLVNKLTNNGTLPVPNPRDWLPEQLQPAAPPAPPQPPASSTLASPLGNFRVYLSRFAAHTAEHPYAYASVALGLSGTASYYFAPQATLRALQPLTNCIPAEVLPDPKNRPLRLVPAQHGVAGEIRKEAVVVLGADSPHGREIALDLERRGFVVVATVADPALVDSLERTSRGWLKVLVLDPQESSSVSPFLRSLSTALSLRYPLHSSGDPFSRPAHALALTGVINCLSLAASSPTTGMEPYPLEATENDFVRRQVGERVATVVGVVKGLLPILRTAAARPGAPTGVLLSLVPSASSNLSLPFASLTSAADAAISSVLHSLRRELAASSAATLVRITTLEVGFFQTSGSGAPGPAAVPQTAKRIGATPALPIRLESLYAPALARRALIVPEQNAAAPTREGNNGGAKYARKGSEMRRLCRRVWQVLVRPNHASAVGRIGSGSFTYLLVSYLPHAVVDLCLSVQDSLYGIYLSHVRALLSSSSSSRPRRTLNSSSGRPPLPTPPTTTTSANPLRPGPAQVPLSDPFMTSASTRPPPPASSTASSSHRGGYSSSDEASSQSSLEDFGPIHHGGGGGYGYASGTASMGGSFVSVGREDLPREEE
ncbi:hypothetical protein JCM10908_004325 [Rhodotorula pacifica]|uniref:uncharacterized protein n=1 Tax=Rhodotorula pacifica TaxID=1495444 RepID=UPI003179A4F0